MNSTLAVPSITASAPLAAGASVAVQLVFTLNSLGVIRFKANAEATAGAGASVGAGNGTPVADNSSQTIGIAPTPVLDPGSDSNINTDKITNDTTPTLTGTAPAGSVVRVYTGFVPPLQVPGTATADSSGHYSFTPSTPLADGSYPVRVTYTQNNITSYTSSPFGLSVVVDSTRPAVTGTPVFNPTLPQKFTYTFNESVALYFRTADLTLLNLGTGAAVPARALLLTGTVLTFPRLPGDKLPSGNYRLTVNHLGLTDVAGNTMLADHVINFTVTAPLIISELRMRGPNGALDEFIELYNPNDTEYQVTTSDGSSGWSVAASDGVTWFVTPTGRTSRPAGTFWVRTIPLAGTRSARWPHRTRRGRRIFPTPPPARAACDAAWCCSLPRTPRTSRPPISSIPPARRVSLTRCTKKARASSTSRIRPSRRSSAFLPAARRPTRKTTPPIFNSSAPPSRTARAFPRRARAGDLTSAVRANGALSATQLDTGVAASASPNRVRVTTSGGTAATQYGTYTIRRKFTNIGTDGTVHDLLFRVVNLANSAAAADLRPLTSVDVTMSSGTVLVHGTTLEFAAGQPEGGGLNSTFVVSSPLFAAPGQSFNVQFTFGVARPGDIDLALNAETRSFEDLSIRSARSPRRRLARPPPPKSLTRPISTPPATATSIRTMSPTTTSRRSAARWRPAVRCGSSPTACRWHQGAPTRAGRIP